MTKHVFLTFDDGPKPATSDVLSVLVTNDCLASFFLTGSNMPGREGLQAELAGRMVNDGHCVGNHCFIHAPAQLRDYVEAYGNLEAINKKEAFRANLEENVSYFAGLLRDEHFAMRVARLPGDGRFHKPSVCEVLALGYIHVGWDYEFAPNGVMRHVGQSNWQGIPGLSCTHHGLPKSNGILLLHDAHWLGRLDTLDAMLKKLTANGYKFSSLT